MFSWLKNKLFLKKESYKLKIYDPIDVYEDKQNCIEATWKEEKRISQELALSYSKVTQKDEIDKIIITSLKYSHQKAKFVQFSKFTMEDIIVFLKNTGFEDTAENSSILNDQLIASYLKEEIMILKKTINAEYYELIHLGFDHNGYQSLHKQTVQNTIYI